MTEEIRLNFTFIEYCSTDFATTRSHQALGEELTDPNSVLFTRGGVEELDPLGEFHQFCSLRVISSVAPLIRDD